MEDEIKILLRERGMMAKFFAVQIKIHPVTFSQLINEKVNMTETSRDRILEGLVSILGLDRETAENIMGKFTIRKDRKNGTPESNSARYYRTKKRRKFEAYLKIRQRG